MSGLARQTRPPVNATAADADDLLAELYELDQQTDPENTAILEIIWRLWEERGDIETATEVAKQILKRNPLHVAARNWLKPPIATARSPSPPPESSSASASSSEGSTTTAATSPLSFSRLLPTWPVPQIPLQTDAARGEAAEAAAASVNSTPAGRISRLRPAGGIPARKARSLSSRLAKEPLPLGQPPQTEAEMLEIESKIESLFDELRGQAAELEWDLLLLAHVGVVDNQSLSQDLLCLKEGMVSEVVMPPPQARPVRRLVSELHEDNWQRSLQIVVDDFVQVAQWALDEAEVEAQTRDNPAQGSSAPASASAPSRLDTVRERLRRRQAALDAMLPESLEGLGRTAVLHVEHELVLLGDKTYANSETMLGDNVVDIPPENLLVTADNYAWDMSELADALAANSAVMRNPLTRDMFDDQDVRRILAHPLGERLKPMTLAQSELKKGVRPDTISRVEALSKVMLEDQSAHATPTLEALDVFLAYFHTLPPGEKATLKQLNIPARDSHTGVAYDSSILEAVQDAKANRVCFHKAGDFLKQAAAYLKRAV